MALEDMCRDSLFHIMKIKMLDDPFVCLLKSQISFSQTILIFLKDCGDQTCVLTPVSFHKEDVSV